MVKVDKDKCIGCGLCASTCPEVFELGEDGKAEIIAQKDVPCVKKAKSECPVQAIK